MEAAASVEKRATFLQIGVDLVVGAKALEPVHARSTKAEERATRILDWVVVYELKEVLDWP